MADLRSVGPPPKDPLTSTNAPDKPIVVEVRTAIEAMTWLNASDKGLVALALKYAAGLDATEDAKSVGYLGQNLTGVLRALGGAPLDRKTLGIAEPPRGKLQALRAAR